MWRLDERKVSFIYSFIIIIILEKKLGKECCIFEVLFSE